MRPLLSPVLALATASLSAAQEGDVAAPLIIQSIAFADESSLTVRYRAILSGAFPAGQPIATVEARAILDQVHSYMVRNPGPVPGWADLITRDARGHNFIDVEEPLRDPWGHAYVVAPDPDFPNKPRVASLGADGVDGTGDDIVAGSTQRLRR